MTADKVIELARTFIEANEDAEEAENAMMNTVMMSVEDATYAAGKHCGAACRKAAAYRALKDAVLEFDAA